MSYTGLVRMIAGLQGGGKTYTAMRFIAMEIASTDRWVITNLTEIKLPEFALYFAELYPQLDIDISKRLQIIPKEETTRWYRYRGDYTLPVFDHKLDARGKAMELPEERDVRMAAYFAQVYELHPNQTGCVYFLDEGHRHFRADSWVEFAAIGAFYLTQLRHLRDLFWLITQNSEQVTPSIRRITWDTHYLRNSYLESFMLWKKPGGFSWAQYLGCPKWDNMVGGSVEPMDTGKVKLDKKLANCYRTRGALGGKSELQDEKSPNKKLPLWTLWAGVAVASAAALLLFMQIPKAASFITQHVVGGFVSGDANKRVVAAMGGDRPAKVPALPQSRETVVDRPSASRSTAVSPGPADSPKLSPVTVDFWAIRGAAVRVGLSNGTVLTDADRLIRSIDSGGVSLVDGRRLAYSPRVSRPKTAVFTASKNSSKS